MTAVPRPGSIMEQQVNGTPRLEGMHALTASTTGWIEAGDGPACMFCGEPAGSFQPLSEGSPVTLTLKRLWWCRPCETTWVT